ncbi:MAG: cellulase family glycosylhydrolase [Phycisphaerae bacterium]|nr:cellulase family glycosylhydrolase [Phycisphaerae bacterium]
MRQFCLLFGLLGLCAGYACADVLHRVPGGDFEAPHFAGCDSYVFQKFEGKGTWSHHESGPSEKTAVVGPDVFRRAEATVGWYPRSANIWYTDEGATPTDRAWQVHCDLRWVGGEGGAGGVRTFALRSGDQNSDIVFEVNSSGKRLTWKAGSKSGGFDSATGFDGYWRMAVVRYDPKTGRAQGRFGIEEVFDVRTEPGLAVKTLFWEAMSGEGVHDPGTLFVDNAGACESAVPAVEPVWNDEGTRYRGFTVCTMDRKLLEDAINDWHANQVRYMLCPSWIYRNRFPSTGAAWQALLERLPADLDRAAELGVAVVLDLHTIPNDNPAPVPPNPDPEKNPHWDSVQWWNDEGNLRVMLECWRQMAEICKDREQSIWFDLLNEPLEWSVVHQQPSYPPHWPEWVQQTTDAIRKIDTRHPVVIEPGPGMLCWGFTDFPPIKDSHCPVIYSAHVYQPVIYTHQGVNDVKVYDWPGEFNDHGGGWWDRERLEVEYAPVIAFQKKHGVRINVGEFSSPRWAPHSARYLGDCLDLFEKYGWDWNYHAFREAGIWSLEEPDEVDLYDAEGNYVRTGLGDPNEGLFYGRYGTPAKVDVPRPKEPTERGQVVKKYLALNQQQPTSAPATK